MEGIVKKGEEMLEQDADPAVIDAGLIASAQKVEKLTDLAMRAVNVEAKERAAGAV